MEKLSSSSLIFEASWKFEEIILRKLSKSNENKFYIQLDVKNKNLFEKLIKITALGKIMQILTDSRIFLFSGEFKDFLHIC